jgi:hypothetical protein
MQTGLPMIDNSTRTEPLLAALKATVPFEVELMPTLIERLQAIGQDYPK